MSNFKFGNQIKSEDTLLVTHIFVDSFEHTVKFVIEKGLQVDTIKVTMGLAQEIGLINLDKLNLIYNK